MRLRISVAVFLMASLFGSGIGQAADLERINRSAFQTGGTQPGITYAGRGTLSSDGRYLLFASVATAVVPGVLDLNGEYDIFLKDLNLGTIQLISHAAGRPSRTADAKSAYPHLSANGRFAVFASDAPDLIPDFVPSLGSKLAIYWRDIDQNLTRLVARDAGFAANNLAISGDGRFVVFESSTNASLLVPGSTDTNEDADLFLWNSQNDNYQLISHVAGNPLLATPTPAAAGQLQISTDGSTVVFKSANNSLVSGDTLGLTDVFLYDPQSGNLQLASHASGESNAPGNGYSYQICAVSTSGRFVLFESSASNLDAGVTDANGLLDLFVFDRDTGVVELISKVPEPDTAAANGQSLCGTLSGDGRFVFIRSTATNLVPGIIYTDSLDYFVRDRQKGFTSLITRPYWSPVHSSGKASGWGAAATESGNLFIFPTDAVNLANISHFGEGPWTYRYDPFLQQLSPALERAHPPAGTADNKLSDLSADGTASTFESYQTMTTMGPERDYSDLVQRLDVEGGQASLAAPAAFAGTGSPSRPFSSFLPALLAGDGSKIAFTAGSIETCGGYSSSAVCLYDRTHRTSRNINHTWNDPQVRSNGYMELLDISAQTGRYLLVQSTATNQAPMDQNGTWDLFLYDTENQAFDLISQSSSSATTTADGSSYNQRGGVHALPPMMSADATRIAFQSQALNLVAGIVDNNGGTDVFLRDRLSGGTQLVSHAVDQALVAADSSSDRPVMAALGGYVVYQSKATNLVPDFLSGNIFGYSDIYLFDVAANSSTLVTHAADAPSQGGNGYSNYPTHISATGRFVAYTSSSSNLIVGGKDHGGNDVFRFDRTTGLNTLVSHAAGLPLTSANGGSGLVDTSSDGRFMLFYSSASDLVPGQTSTTTRLFLWDADDGSVRLVSHQRGNPSQAVSSYRGELSPDNGRVFFLSDDDSVIPGVASSGTNLYVWEKATDKIELLTPRFSDQTSTSQGGCELNGVGRVLDDGRGILFQSSASDLLPYDNNSGMDLFLVHLPLPLFADGFESGTISAWSAVLP